MTVSKIPTEKLREKGRLDWNDHAKEKIDR